MPDAPGIEFALKLGRALQVYGTPTHRLEESMSEIVRLLGIRGHFYSTPTAIFAQFDERVEIVRIESSDTDLGKLSRLDRLSAEVVRGEKTATQASAEVDEIVSATAEYGTFTTLASFALTSGAASRFFGAGLKEVTLSIAMGLAVGLLALLARRVTPLARLFDPMAGFVVSLLAVAGAIAVGQASVPIITVAGLIVLVPGLTLTIAISELAQRNLVSGTARLNGAIVVFLMLGFGVAAGGNLAALIFGQVPLAQPIALPLWTEAAAVLTACVTLTVLFRAASEDLFSIAIGCILTYIAVRQVSLELGPEMGVFFGALTAGVYSNIHTRIFGKPTAVTRLPAMMLLVPGGLGFLSISSLLQQDVMSGMKTAFSVALMAVALVTGLIISNALLPPARKL